MKRWFLRNLALHRGRGVAAECSRISWCSSSPGLRAPVAPPRRRPWSDAAADGAVASLQGHSYNFQQCNRLGGKPENWFRWSYFIINVQEKSMFRQVFWVSLCALLLALCTPRRCAAAKENHASPVSRGRFSCRRRASSEGISARSPRPRPH